MSHVPFPHVLSSRIELLAGLLRIVSDGDDIGSDTIVQFEGAEPNRSTGRDEPVYSIWKFTEIKERRLAKGDWKGWPKWPMYYSGTGKLIKRDFISNLGEFKELINKANKAN